MTAPLPAWIRSLLALDRAAEAARRTQCAVRDEVLFAAVPSAERNALTAALYATKAVYRVDSAQFRTGLLDWELDALRTPAFPAAGRVLLGGAGGGRELAELSARGYTVTAFEPSPLLAAGARTLAARYEGAVVIDGSYEDLVGAIREGSGPLADVLGSPTDAVIFGWGSFSHVLGEGAAESLLSAVRALAPHAPILLSFLPKPDETAGRLGQLRHRLRTALRHIAVGAPPAAGEGFSPAGGFYRGYCRAEIVALATSTGYSVALYNDAPYPHALLTPL